MLHRIKIVGKLGFVLLSLLATQAKAEGILIVPTNTIYPGEEIRGSMVRDARFADVYIARGGKVRERSELFGKVASRTLIVGRPIARRYLRQAFAVRAGEIITLRYKLRGLSIETKAVSLKSAAAGQVIQTRNVDTGLKVIGVVRVDGSVEVMAK